MYLSTTGGPEEAGGGVVGVHVQRAEGVGEFVDAGRVVVGFCEVGVGGERVREEGVGLVRVGCVQYRERVF